MIPFKRGGWPFANPPNSQFTLNTMSPQARGLVAWWPTLGSFGAMALRDFSAYANAGILQGGLGWKIHQQLGQVLDFDGTGGDYVDISAARLPTGAAARTIVLWFVVPTTDQRSAFSYGINAAGQRWTMHLGASTVSVEVSFTEWGDDTLALSGVHQVAMVFPPGGIQSSDILIYLDGLLLSSATLAGAPQNINTNAGGNWIIGADWDLDPVQDGPIGEVRAYNRALSAAEVWALYDPATRWELYRPVARFWAGISLISGETVWGHDTDVAEANVRDFSGNWAGTGTIELAGDSERLRLDAGESMVSEVVDTGSVTVELLQNNYDPTGDDVDLDYRHGATEAACLAAGWNDYTVPFVSLGFVQVRVTSTL